MEPNVDRGMWSVVALLAAIVIGGVVLIAFPKITGKIANSMDDMVNDPVGAIKHMNENTTLNQNFTKQDDGVYLYTGDGISLKSKSGSKVYQGSGNYDGGVINLFSVASSDIGYYKPVSKETGIAEFTEKTGTHEYTMKPFSHNKDATYYYKTKGTIPLDQINAIAELTTIQFHNKNGEVFALLRFHEVPREVGDFVEYNISFNKESLSKQYPEQDVAAMWDGAEYISLRSRWLVNGGDMTLSENKKVEDYVKSPFDVETNGNARYYQSEGGRDNIKFLNNIAVKKGETYKFNKKVYNHGVFNIEINIDNNKFIVQPGETKTIETIIKADKNKIPLTISTENKYETTRFVVFE